MPDYETSFAKWNLTIHRVSQTSVEIWVGTLFPTMKKPDAARIQVLGSEGVVLKTKSFSKEDWRRPFRQHNQRFYFLHTFKGLLPRTFYRVEFQRKEHGKWQTLKDGSFDTLPDELPTSGDRPFTIGLGSCFYNHRDGGQAAGAYKALYERGTKPDVTFLVGDQVYLDIGFDSLSMWPSEIRQRIADDYADHWQDLGSILSRGGTWMLPDDHEYWNDYPFYDSLIPTLLALKVQYVRGNWTRAAKDAVYNIQRSNLIDVFSIGDDLSVCLADVRSQRKKSGFLPAKAFKVLIDWAQNLKSPGVLVMPQPLIVSENKTEKNLLSFSKQYAELVKAIAVTGHDVVLLSGDVHYGRIAKVSLGAAGGRLIEIISSPLSNLTGLNGIATSTAKAKPKKFPDPSVSLSSIGTQAVDYDSDYFVSTKKGRTFSAYPRDRTMEHFMTVSFSKTASGAVKLVADAWASQGASEIDKFTG